MTKNCEVLYRRLPRRGWVTRDDSPFFNFCRYTKKNRVGKRIITYLALSFCLSSYGFENAVYILKHENQEIKNPADKVLTAMQKNYKKIDILLAQAYAFDTNGVISGSVDPDILNFAKTHSVKLMPLFKNADFDRPLAHKFLINSAMQESALQFLLRACQQNHFYGIQFDLENVAFADKNLLTNFYEKAAKLLHDNGFKVSYAVAPLITDIPDPSIYLGRLYNKWQGSYDFKALGKSADFLSIMAYGNHETGTTPGPAAGLKWDESTD